ncbi:MAG: type I restriction enzyme HsdR N-terminal domain-containing protein [Bacteroidia bacterium]|nr:type I restriction enzyme HsdR N-terminal domain-containing protein [Bacteroidia bacterium]MDW8014747.1 type I restriction enzyme HsdR N-terminal domain-containing protein [Bacteroidia bacterium]
MKETLWDPVRRRMIRATPEEAIRQRLIQLLLKEGYPLSAIQVEYQIGQAGRFDVAVSAPDGTLWLLAECKAPTSDVEAAWQQAWTQLRRYKRNLPSPRYLAVAVGELLWCWEAATGTLLQGLPPYPRKDA